MHVQRDLLSKRRRVTRLKKTDISDDTVTEVKPRQVRRGSQFRSPGRPQGISIHQRSFRLPPVLGNSTPCSASSSETALEEVEKAEKVDTEDRQLAEMTSAAELNHRYVINGGHDYYQMSNDDLFTDRCAVNGTVFGTCKRLDLVNHTVTDLSDNKSFVSRWDKALESSSFGFVNGAKMSRNRNVLLAGVEADHAYAKRPQTLDQSRIPHHITDDDVDSVFTRLTVMNARSSHPRRPSCHNYAASLPCLQKCSVTLSKLNDAVLKQQPTIRLQLRSLEQQHHSSPEEHSAIEETKPHSCHRSNMSDAAITGSCLPSVCSDMSVGNAHHTIDMSNLTSNFVCPSDFTFASGSGEGAWLPSSVSHNSGLELLASVSSLTADRMQEQQLSRPVNANCSNNEQHSVHDSSSTDKKHPMDTSCRTDEPVCTKADENYQQLSQVTSNTNKRCVKVFCVRNKCSVDEESRLCHDDLLNVVRDYITQGSSGPVCGTLSCRLCGQTHGSCSHRSEDIVCNSVQLMHSSCSSLQNGLTEQL